MKILVVALLASVALQCTAKPSIWDGLTGEPEKKVVVVEKKNNGPLDIFGQLGDMVGGVIGTTNLGKDDSKLPLLELFKGGLLSNILQNKQQIPIDIHDIASGDINLLNGDAIGMMVKTLKKLGAGTKGLIGLKKALTLVLDIFANGGKQDYRALICAVLQELADTFGADQIGKLLGIEDFSVQKLWKILEEGKDWKKWLKTQDWGEEEGGHGEKWPIEKLGKRLEGLFGGDDHNDGGVKVKVKRDHGREDSSEEDDRWGRDWRGRRGESDRHWRNEDSREEENWRRDRGSGRHGHGRSWEDLRGDVWERNHERHGQGEEWHESGGRRWRNDHGRHRDRESSEEVSRRHDNHEYRNTKKDLSRSNTEDNGDRESSGEVDWRSYADHYRKGIHDQETAPSRKHSRDEEYEEFRRRQRSEQRKRKDRNDDWSDGKSWEEEDTHVNHRDHGKARDHGNRDRHGNHQNYGRWEQDESDKHDEEKHHEHSHHDESRSKHWRKESEDKNTKDNLKVIKLDKEEDHDEGNNERKKSAGEKIPVNEKHVVVEHKKSGESEGSQDNDEKRVAVVEGGESNEKKSEDKSSDDKIIEKVADVIKKHGPDVHKGKD